MRRNILFLVLISFLFTVQNATAADSKVVHTLKPGQTLSADVLNEILEALSYTDKIPTRDDFLGSWTCRRVTNDLATASLYGPNPTPEQGILYVVTGDVVFTTDGLGNYTATDNTTPTILYPIFGGGIMETVMQNQPYATKDSFLYLTFLSYNDLMTPPQWVPYTEIYKPTFRSATQFSLEHRYSIAGNNGGSLTCDRTDIPPSTPELTDNIVSGNDIVLQWTDKSDDETGFVILRRDSLEGSWQEIASVSAVAGVGTTQSYTDSGVSAGTYWYRIKAVNANGKSFGSNLTTKITIQ